MAYSGGILPITSSAAPELTNFMRSLPGTVCTLSVTHTTLKQGVLRICRLPQLRTNVLSQRQERHMMHKVELSSIMSCLLQRPKHTQGLLHYQCRKAALQVVHSCVKAESLVQL